MRCEKFNKNVRNLRDSVSGFCYDELTTRLSGHQLQQKILVLRELRDLHFVDFNSEECFFFDLEVSLSVLFPIIFLCPFFGID